jgi:hypothetical protein
MEKIMNIISGKMFHSNLFFLIFIVALLLTTSGCSTIVKMSPSRDDTKLNQSQDAFVLLSLRMDHPLRPSSPPEPKFIVLSDDHKGGKFQCLIDKDARVDEVNGPYYLLRIPIPAGHYTARFVWAENGDFLSRGFASMPIFSELTAQPGKIIYLGQVHGYTREKREGEFGAGPYTINALDTANRALQGWSNATWEVEVIDSEMIDLANFRKYFPSLKEAKIEKHILPQFDRKKVQAAWDKSGPAW